MVGTYRTIPAGISVFSTALQENITFERDVIVEITNTIYGGSNFVFGKLKILLYTLTNPSLLDKANGSICFNIVETTEYKLPEPDIYRYEKM